MGEVYRADDLKLGQTVALKFLPRALEDDPQRHEYFHSEVRLSRQISHPNVCRVYDIGEVNGQHFLSMEYIDGEDLKSLLRRIGRLPKGKGIQLAQQLCAGLAAAHEQGVLHRDLKPANIMIDGRGQVRITDFGLAKFAEDGAEGEVAGTPAYMAPEQLARGQTTIQSDLYSLGLILHELFTGEAVHKSNSIPELLQQHQESSISEPSTLVDDMDPAVERVIVRCLQKDAHQRPKSAREVAAALPGGDPLLAALAAGETPSPEMVAAAGDDTRIDRRLAIAALAGVAVFLLLNVWLADRTSSANQLANPDVLLDRLRDRDGGGMLANELGYTNAPAETIHGFDVFPDLNRAASFWYRERPDGAGFDMNAFWSSIGGRFQPQPSRARPNFFVPDQNVPGELAVLLSGDKRLLYFRAVPAVETISKEENKDVVSSPRWSEWFTPKRTGFYLPAEGTDVPPKGAGDVKVLEIVKDRWRTPPDAYDLTGVWRGTADDGSTFLVEAAAFRGKPTYFIRMPETKFQSHTRLGPKAVKYIVDTSGSGFQAILLVAGIVLAWRNSRLGRGDRRGGRRLAAYVFAIELVVLLCQSRHSSHFGFEYRYVLTMGLSQVLFSTARIWVWYMALEPYIRRVWPQILTSSSRLLEGRVCDRVVGRDLLVGTLCGVFLQALWRLNVLVQTWLGVKQPPVDSPHPLTLAGVRELLGSVSAVHAVAFRFAFGCLMLLLVSRIILKSERRAMVAFVAILTPVVGLLLIGGHPGITLMVTVFHCSVLLLVLVRFGILALLVNFTAILLCGSFPLTLDATHWYFDRGMFAVVLIAGIALFGFYTSLGGRRALSTSWPRPAPAA